MNANELKKLLPPTDRNGVPSVDDTANPDELVANFGIASPQVSAVAFVMLILSGFSALAKVYDSDGSAGSVQALHNAGHDGDTITLPAGTFSWTARLNITKGITLQGATTITGPASNPTITDATIIKDDTPRSGSTGVLSVRINASQSFRLTGITFTAGSSTSYAAGNGAFHFNSTDSSPAMSVRIDHCHFDSLYQGKLIWTNGWLYGVADHNVLDCRKKTQSFLFSLSTYGGPSKQFGNGSWADYPYYGTDKFFFVEDCRINGDGTNELSGNSDTLNGARYVFRHNYWVNAQPNSHGTEGGLARGVRAYEVYDNSFHWTIAPPAAGQRSGTSLWHDNTWTGIEQGGRHHTNLPNFRETPARPKPVWGIADGTSSWDVNDTEGNGTSVEGHPPFLFESGTDTSSVNSQGVLHDSTKNWVPNQWAGYSIRNTNPNAEGYNLGSYIISNTSNTITYYYYPASDAARHLIFNAGDTYQIHRVLIMMDQNGRGKADQVIGNRPVNWRTGRASWPHNALEPCFSWNNVYTPNGDVLGFNTRPAQPTTKPNLDYFNLGGGFPADTTPAAVSSKYTAALNGVAYTGTFTYPHPLVSGTQPPPNATRGSSNTSRKEEKKLKKKKRRPTKFGE